MSDEHALVPVSAAPQQAMRCYVCDGHEWHKVMVDRGQGMQPIHGAATTQVCKGCGNVCHEVDVSKEDSIREFYRKEYRPQPGVMNLITTTHKLNYMKVFLAEQLKAMSGSPKIVGDVGAATGYALNFFRGLGHKVSGSELTLTFRRMSEHYYGIPLAEDLETKHKYDLIVVYHVLEHLMEPDQKLAHFASLLSEGGRIFLATPEWFNYIEDGCGLPMRHFDELFHKNHINLFSSTSLNNLFRKVGLRVVKEDHLQYGQTYLLEKSPDGPETERERWLTKEDWREVVKTLQATELAIRLHSAGRYREARDLYPKFPEAWLSQAFGPYCKDLSKQVDILGEAEKHIGQNYRFKLAKGQWLYQQGRLAEAVAVFKDILTLKPAEDIYMYLGYSFAQLGKPQDAMQAFAIACAMDPRKWGEAQGWMLKVSCDQPAWDERMLAEAAKSLKVTPTQETAAGGAA